jgi:hypothetical protein
VNPLTAAFIAVQENVERLRGAPGSDGKPGKDGNRGAPGVQGPQGKPGLIWRGEWKRATAYGTGDVIESEGSAYVAVTPSTGSKPPGRTWDLLAKAGKDGRNGGGGGSVAPSVYEEGTPLGTFSEINFVGAGVTATRVGPRATVTISGGSVTPAEFVEPTTATPEAIALSLIAAGLMEAS